MRVHLLLILFFASTILARSARNRRDTSDLITLKLPVISTTEVSNGNKTTDVTGDNHNGTNCENNIFSQPLRIILNLIKSMILVTNNTLSMFLKALNSTSDFVQRAMLKPFVIIFTIMIRILERILQFFNSKMNSYKYK